MEQISFKNANSRDTYFTIHNVKNAQRYATGKNIRVGIIDWMFAYEENSSLYSGYINLSQQDSLLLTADGHGHMMADTLKEIAPDCEIYAINGVVYDGENDEQRIMLFEESIEWAIQNKIHILTYSHSAFYGDNRTKANEAIKTAYDNGIITTFIHNDSIYNLWPYGCLEFFIKKDFSRLPDLNIYHFDYNVVFTKQYEEYMRKISIGEKIKSGNDIPFFSFSSMSPVLAGFVAMIKELKPQYSFEQIKDLLLKTSYEITEKGEHWYDTNPCKNVVDIGKAIELLTQ